MGTRCRAGDQAVRWVGQVLLDSWRELGTRQGLAEGGLGTRQGQVLIAASVLDNSRIASYTRSWLLFNNSVKYYSKHSLCTPHVHLTYTPCTPYVHPMYTLCTPHVHSHLHPMYTPCTPYVHPMYTLCTPCVHPMYTLCTPYVHSMYAITPSLLHCRYSSVNQGKMRVLCTHSLEALTFTSSSGTVSG